MSRKTARENVYKLIFEYLFNKEKDSFSYLTIKENPNVSEEDLTFINSLYLGAVEHFDEIIEKISANAKGFSLDRIYKPDLAALVLAVYEMCYTDIPKSVAISEVLDIVKAYSTEKSSGYVNGILASVYKELTGEQ